MKFFGGALIFLSFSASGFSIQSSDDVLKLLRESQTWPGKPIVSKTYIEKNCSEMPFKHSPFQTGWDCKPTSNIQRFGTFEYMKSGFTAFTQIQFKVCERVKKTNRNKCLLDFLEKFTKAKDRKLSTENHSLEFTQEDLEFSLGDLTYSYDGDGYKLINLYIEPKTEVQGVGELGKYLLGLAAISSPISRNDYKYHRQRNVLEKNNHKFYEFVTSPPKTEYGKKIRSIWDNEDKFYNDVVSKIQVK